MKLLIFQQPRDLSKLVLPRLIPLSLHKSPDSAEIGARMRGEIFMQLSAGLKLRPISIKINQGNL